MIDAVAAQLDAVPAFDLGERSYAYGDVIRAAMLRGEAWDRAGLGLIDRADANASEIRGALVAFRRSHGLLSAQDYREWLAQRELNTVAVDAYLRGAEPQAPQQLRAVLILSGCLGAWAGRLADCAAVTAARAPGRFTGTEAGAAHLQALTDCEAQFREELLAESALERVISEHGLEWQRLDWEELELDSEGAAREAALWMRVDGLAISEVAGLAHAEPHPRSSLYCDVPQAVSPLLAATPGQLVGPLADGEAWRLAALNRRSGASPADAELRARAAAELVEHGLERYRAGRIRWHVEL